RLRLRVRLGSLGGRGGRHAEPRDRRGDAEGVAEAEVRDDARERSAEGHLDSASGGARTGTLIVIVATMRPSGFRFVRDWIVAVATVRRVAVEVWFVTIMKPTSLPSGPLG